MITEENHHGEATEVSGDTIPVLLGRQGEAGCLGADKDEPIPIEVGKLQASLKSLSGKLNSMFHDLRAVGEFELNEIQVSVEISSEGGVSLIGSLKAGAKGAISLTFKPKA